MSLFRNRKIVTQLSLSVLLVAVIVAPALAEEGVKDADYGPGKKKPIPRRVFWGDTHLHTSFSPDAGLAGNVKLGPAEAYKFASGGTVMVKVAPWNTGRTPPRAQRRCSPEPESVAGARRRPSDPESPAPSWPARRAGRSRALADDPSRYPPRAAPPRS